MVSSNDVVGIFLGCDDWHKGAVLGWVSLVEGQDDILQNFIAVLGSSHIGINDPKVIS